MNNNSELENDQLTIARGILGKNKTYGLINNKGSIVVDFRFLYIKDFQDGLALGYVNFPSTYGFICNNGYIKWVLNQYSGIESFSEGLAVVFIHCSYEKTIYGFINKNCEETIPLKYEHARSFKCGLAAVQDKNSGYRWGFIDKTGRQIIDFIYDEVGDFNDGLAFVKNILEGQSRFKQNPKYKCGFINLKGVIKINTIYDDVDSFSEGLACVGIRDENGEIKYGFINKQGSLIIKYKFNTKGFFYGDIATITEYTYDDDICTSKSIYINKSGEQIVKMQANNNKIKIFGIGNSDIFYTEENDRGYNKYSLVDGQGNRLTSNYYNDISSAIEGVALVRTFVEVIYNKDDKFDSIKYLYGFINKNGQEITPCKYDNIDYFRNGYAGVCLKGKWSIINKSGEVITKLEYDNINLVNEKENIISIPQYRHCLEYQPYIDNNYMLFRDGYCYVTSDNKFGVINTSGEEVISPFYLDIKPFSEGLAACYDGSGWGFINQNGSVVIPCKYFEVGDFHYGLAPIRIGDLWGYIDKSNKIVIKPSFLAADRFYKNITGGLCATVRKWDGKSPQYSGYSINENGKVLEQVY